MVKATVVWKDGTEQTAYATDWKSLFEQLGDGEIQSIIGHQIKISDMRQGKYAGRFERSVNNA